MFQVIFAPAGSLCLLGATALEAFGRGRRSGLQTAEAHPCHHRRLSRQQAARDGRTGRLTPGTHMPHEFEAAGPHGLRDGTTVTLRRVRADDADRFVEYFDGLSERSRYFYHPFAFERTSAEAVTSDLDSQDWYRIVATAERGGQETIVGYAWLQGITGPDLPMLGIGIIDDYHERGIGKLLLRVLIGVGHGMGLQAIRLGVNDDNPRAIHVYESVGFRHDTAKPPQDRGSHKQLYMVCDVR